MRLQRYLAACGVASRRRAEELITQGRVWVNGAPAVLGARIDPATDEVAVDGAPVRPEKHTWVLLNKPAGTLTTADDPHGRPTVLDLLADVAQRVFPVGRLDFDVEGALLLTNDGDLAFRLTHPRFGVAKTYLAEVGGAVEDSALERLRRGVMLEDGPTAPAEVSVERAGPRHTVLRITIREGRKREVKRMCAAVRHPVLRMRRETFAGMGVGDLKPGQWRYLSDAEVDALRRLAEQEEARDSGA